MAPQPTITWSIDNGGVGSVNTTGLYTAPTNGAGSAIVRATSAGVSGTASVSVTVNALAPTVKNPAAATPNPINALTTNLSVLGADNGGEAGLTYTWAAIGSPPAPVNFSANGTNAAKNVAATFNAAGVYTLQATITNSSSLTVLSSVSVTVNQTLTSITVSPASTAVPVGSTQKFAATAVDQFGNPFSAPPTFGWSVSGGGTIDSTGLFTAGAAAGGPFTITATSGGLSGTASITLHQPPSVATAAIAAPATVSGTATNLSVLGADIGGEASLLYTWSVTGTPPAPVTYSSNGVNASKNTTATFTAAGVYNFLATITNTNGLTATSSVSVTVKQTLTSIAVSPPSDSVTINGTRQFTAVAQDQFGKALVLQPVLAWNVSGGGTVNSAGLFTAAGTAGGPFTLSAASSGISGTSSVTISPSSGGLALSYSTFLGGPFSDYIRGMTGDSAGNIYVTGGTNGPGFPTTPGAYQQNYTGGTSDTFVAKLNPQGQVVWSTLLGGQGEGGSLAFSVAVDSQGYVYVGGRAEPGLPTTPGSLQPSYQGNSNSNAYIAKFTPDGSHLVWASYIGTGQTVSDLKVDGSGNVYATVDYVAGGSVTAPPTAWFASGYQKVPQGGSDEYILKIKSDSTQVLAGTYLSGSGSDTGGSISLDSAGNVFYGTTTTSGNMPTTNGFDKTYAGGNDFYLAKLSSDLSTLSFGTYLGGSGSDSASFHDVRVDSQGNPVVSINTTSTGLFTSPGAIQSTMLATGSNNDIYLARIAANGSQVLGATYLGGTGNNFFTDGHSVDSQGNIYVGWDTTTTNLSVTSDAIQAANGGGTDIFVAKISSDFTTLLYGTYLGGTGQDNNRSTLVDPSGNFYIVGDTTSPNFPVKNAWQGVTGGGQEAFVAKFLPTSSPAVSLSVSPTAYTVPATITLSTDGE